MPATSVRQRRAAAAELQRRRDGGERQDKATRPFGSASDADLRDYAESRTKRQRPPRPKPRG